MDHSLSRRDALRLSLLSMAGPSALSLERPPVREVRSFRLRETMGLRRFGYPVHAIVPDAEHGRNYRLLRDGRAIPAQFRIVEGTGGISEVALDFQASPGPLEIDRYEVVFGSSVESGPEPTNGLTIEERDHRFLIRQNGTLTFEIDKNPFRFLRSVGSPRLGYLRGDPGGLKIVGRKPVADPRLEEGGKAEARVTRHGPMAVGLRLTHSDGSPVSTTLDITIPGSKSWVEVVATLRDPEGQISAIEWEVPLEIEGKPTLVDFGAGTTVYGQIQGTEQMELSSGPVIGESTTRNGWTVRRGEGSNATILASATGESARLAEGWAHVMDARRCLAVGMANFGAGSTRDRIEVRADGRVRVIREWTIADTTPVKGPKSMKFWLHFVPMPVQIGAATSPQSMMAPLRVDWDRTPSVDR